MKKDRIIKMLAIGLLGLLEQARKFRRILDQRDGGGPEEDALALLDVVAAGQAHLFQALLAVIDDALQGVVDVAHVPVFKQQLLEPVAGHATLPVVDEDLQQARKLRFVRL